MYKVYSNIIGTWNVGKMMDIDQANRPERRIALIARELVSYKVQVAALSGTRLAEEGQVTGVRAG